MIQGKYITLRTARVNERKLIFDMGIKTNILTYSDTYNKNLESFMMDYEERYFDNRDPSSCGGMMICLKDTIIGFLSYDTLRNGIMEIDIWMDGEKHCGKGFGSDAVFTITDYLNQKYNVRTFFMCPSKMNVRAICAYKKAGFRQVSAIEKQSMIQNLFTYDEIQSLKQDTECFSDEFVFMIKLYDNEK